MIDAADNLANLRRQRANLAQVLRIQFAWPPERRSYLLIRECIERARAIDLQLKLQSLSHH